MLSHEDERQITAVLTAYATAVDSRQWAALHHCFTDDFVGDYGTLGQFPDRNAIVDTIQRVHEPMGPTLHRISNMTIAGDGDRATARTYVDALLTQRDGSAHMGAGFYDDELVRSGSQWRIRRRKLTLVYLDSRQAASSSV